MQKIFILSILSCSQLFGAKREILCSLGQAIQDTNIANVRYYLNADNYDIKEKNMLLSWADTAIQNRLKEKEDLKSSRSGIFLKSTIYTSLGAIFAAPAAFALYNKENIDINNGYRIDEPDFKEIKNRLENRTRNLFHRKNLFEETIDYIGDILTANPTKQNKSHFISKDHIYAAAVVSGLVSLGFFSKVVDTLSHNSRLERLHKDAIKIKQIISATLK